MLLGYDGSAQLFVRLVSENRSLGFLVVSMIRRSRIESVERNTRFFFLFFFVLLVAGEERDFRLRNICPPDILK